MLGYFSGINDFWAVEKTFTMTKHQDDPKSSKTDENIGKFKTNYNDGGNA